MKKTKTALITGASGGLGSEFASLCAKKKYDLVLVARNHAKLTSLKEDLENRYGITVYLCLTDLSLPDAALEVFRFVQENGLRIDLLINNAGFGDSGDFAESDWKRQADMVQVNVTALMQLTHCFLKPMMAQGGGRILNIASIAAFSAGPTMSVYFATKAFVASFSESVADEVKGSGVSVTAFFPGPTHTGFQQAAQMDADTVMFRSADRADVVAKRAFRAMMRRKVLSYCGLKAKVTNLLSRLSPRVLSRRFARKLTGVS